MPDIELNFMRYVRARRGAEEARVREGAAYAYGADLKLLRATEKLRPVGLAVEGAVRLWKGLGEERLLGDAMRVTAQSHPALARALTQCAETLHVPPPAVYVVARPEGPPAQTLGTNESPYVVVGAPALDLLTEAELRHLLGRELGHVHNQHALYLTTLHLLAEGGGFVVKWASQPAILALRAWARRADVTADRAGLLCTRDLAASISAVLVLALGSRERYREINVAEYLTELVASNERLGRLGTLTKDQPRLPQRLEALRVFARSAYFRGACGLDGGLTTQACDAQIRKLGLG
ncbi:MAG TPA: M48 family metallopeptidase [Polyangia bacterium]|jgi:Zn-dependent protease with chaperone function